MTRYNPKRIQDQYNKVAKREDEGEKRKYSLRNQMPRYSISKLVKKNMKVLDAGGGSGINSILMAKKGAKITLLDLSDRLLEIARKNIKKAKQEKNITVIHGDITNLSLFRNNSFDLVVCAGDSLSYVLSGRFKAIKELVRVCKHGKKLILGCDGKYGFMALNLHEGHLKEALSILKTNETIDGMGAKTHLYTIEEMKNLLEKNNCKLLEYLSMPSIAYEYSKTFKQYKNPKDWKKLLELELQISSNSHIAGAGIHLLFIAQKNK